MDRFITKKPRLQDNAEATARPTGTQQQQPSTSNSNSCVDKPDAGDAAVTQLLTPKYHANDIGSAVGTILNDNEKYKFLQETWKPTSDYKFPNQKDGKQNRKFRYDWMERYKWLAYSEIKCGGFCKVCVLFAPSGAGSGSQALKTFVKEPLTKFKNALEDMKQHEDNAYHKFCLDKALKFQNIMESGGRFSEKSIAVKMDSKKAQIVEENRKRLRPIIKTVIFCARLPLRGHRDDGQFNYDENASEMISGKMGVFRSLLAFRIDAGDEDLKMHLSTCKRNSSMISKTVQNEVIECIGEVVRTSVVDDIKRNKFFSILCDETADVSSKEQLTFCVRFIDLTTCTTQEAFLGFVEIKSTTSIAIKTAIDQEMSKLGLSYDYLCGQGYDGASNMAGHLNGVQTLISKQQPLALYTHCFSHSLNLCITKTCEIPIIRNVMGTVASISTFVSASPNRVSLLINAIDQSNNIESTKKRLKALCPTRWVERHESLITFKDLLIPVVIMLEDLSTTSYSDVSAKANMLCCAVKKSEFIVGLEVSVYCLSFTLRLSEQLQCPKQDLSSAVQHVEDVLDTFKDIRRNADTEFASIFLNAEKFAEELGFEIHVPRTCNRQTERSNTPGSNAEEYFRRVIFLPFIDHIVSQLNARFTNKDFVEILPLEGLIPSNLSRYTDEQIFEAAKKYEAHLQGVAPLTLLRAEIKLWRGKWNDDICEIPATCTEALKRLDFSFFPLIGVLIQILGTVPVTTATAERSFSVLRRLKTYLRSTMGESRLNGLALTNILKDRDIDIDEVINVFSQKKSRRMAIENWECD